MTTSEAIREAIEAHDHEQLHRILERLTNMEFKRTEQSVRESLLPSLSNELFWEALLGLMKFRRQAFMSGIMSVETLAKKGTLDFECEEAIGLLSECLEYPHNLGEGKLHGAQENDFHYFLGCAYEQLGDYEKAREYWELATVGPQEPAAAMYYNDAKPEKIFYQGMALVKLGRTDEANGRFYRLVNYGKQHIFERQTMDYFAVSLPDLLIWEDSLDRKNRIHCLFMLALGYTGLGDMEHAERYLKEVEEMDINHQGVRALRTLLNYIKFCYSCKPYEAVCSQSH